MLINGCLVKDEGCNIDISSLTEVFKELGFEDDIDNEDLAVITGQNYYSISPMTMGDSDHDILTAPDGSEYWLIHENDVDKFTEEYGEDYFDESLWKDAVAANETTLGFEDWQKDVIDNCDYGELLGTYDGGYTVAGKYYIFRMN